MRRHYLLAWLIVPILGLAALLLPLRAEAAFQRMLLAPGCYVLAPGGHEDVSAYCLDQSLAAPASGAMLSYAPKTYGSATVRVAGGHAMSLQDALRQGIVQVEGLGDHLSVRLVNLTQQRIELCITSPTVLMGNGEFFTGDLAASYGKIAGMLTTAASAAQDGEAHERMQQAIWDQVNAADHDITDKLTERLLSGIVVPQFPANRQGLVPQLTQCAGEVADIEVCAGK